jgi:hypothetical protein
MRPSSQEFTLSNVLSDPLIRTLMAADRVDPVKLEGMLTRIARQALPRVSPVESACGCAA